MQIRTMTAADIPFAQRLKAQNNWNQLDADWRRQLDLEPTACFVAERAGQPVGTTCGCVFGAIAWINFVLVDLDQRGQGIGTALLRHVLRHLDKRGVLTIRLDATPLGQPVYEKLGFVGEFGLSRYEGVMPTTVEALPGVEPMTRADLPAVCRWDEMVTRTRREKLLRHLFDAFPQRARKFAPAGELQGYCLARPGSNAWQVGPIQGTAVAGRALLLDAARQFAGQRVYLDVPTDHAAAVAGVQAFGWTVQRTFLRMSRGQRVAENLERFWSSFGPEKG